MRRLLSREHARFWLMLFAICWGITPLMFYLGDLERGYDATGGEILIPIIPVIVLLLAIADKKTITEGDYGRIRRQNICRRKGLYVPRAPKSRRKQFHHNVLHARQGRMVYR